MFFVRSDPNRKMQVIVSRAGITGVADITDHIAAFGLPTFNQVVRVMIEMRIIIDCSPVRVALIDGCAAFVAVEKLYNNAISSGEDRRVVRGHDVDGVVNTAFGTSILKGVLQLIWLDTSNRKKQTGGPDNWR